MARKEREVLHGCPHARGQITHLLHNHMYCAGPRCRALVALSMTAACAVLVVSGQDVPGSPPGWLLTHLAGAGETKLGPPGTGALPDGLGTNIHFTDPKPGEMKMLAEGGFRWLRMDFVWERIERKKAQYDWSPYDRLLAAGQPHGVKCLPLASPDNDNPLGRAFQR